MVHQLIYGVTLNGSFLGERYIQVHYSRNENDIHGTEITVFVNQAESVYDLKKTISELTSIPIYKLRLFFDRKEMKSDKMLLTDYGLEWGSHVHVLKTNGGFSVVVQTLENNEKPLYFEIDTTTTTYELKKMIMNKMGYQIYDQHILIGDVQLENNDRVIDYTLEPETGLVVFMAKPLKYGGYLNVAVGKERSHRIHVKPNENLTVDEIKGQIANYIGKSKEKLLLKHNGKHVSESLNLKNTQLYDGAWIVVESVE